LKLRCRNDMSYGWWTVPYPNKTSEGELRHKFFVGTQLVCVSGLPLIIGRPPVELRSTFC
jgi:hypothetical protein